VLNREDPQQLITRHRQELSKMREKKKAWPDQASPGGKAGGHAETINLSGASLCDRNDPSLYRCPQTRITSIFLDSFDS